MSEPADFEAHLEPAERELASQLTAERPLPAAEFRGTLGRHLGRRDPGYGPRPARLLALVAMCLGAGGALAALGALLAIGVL